MPYVARHRHKNLGSVKRITNYIFITFSKLITEHSHWAAYVSVGAVYRLNM